MLITILIDNTKSWFFPYAEKLSNMLAKNYEVNFITKHKDIKSGELAFFLACEKLVHKEALSLNKHNLVVHESDLPRGKGWSPLTWQILEGKNSIPITLFEAEEGVDSGEIYFQDHIIFEGHELIDELRKKQGEKTIELVEKFVNCYPFVIGNKQVGESTFYRRRKLGDSELDIDKTLAEQFNLLRVVDNERYPAFFDLGGHTYIINIHKKI